MNTTTQKRTITFDDLPLLVSIKLAAMALGFSERFLWGLHAAEGMPEAVKLGRSVRWRREDLRLWYESGCPKRSEFERLKKAGAA